MNKRPEIPISFKGLVLSGNPARRPAMTAAVCTNVRIMPGNWIRLRGGRVARHNLLNSQILQIVSFKDPNFPGSSLHMAQIVPADGHVVWQWFDVVTYTPDPFNLINIPGTWDGNHSATKLAASAYVTDRPVQYNGEGHRMATRSIPPFTTFYSGVMRFFGLDAWVPGNVPPTVSFSAGAGYHNFVKTGVDIYVSTYHEPTGHCSNAVKCGTIAPTGDGVLGEIRVSNLQRLIQTYNNITEQSELYYVFYATIDGGKVPYRIFNSLLDGPLKVPSTSSSASLSVAPASVDNPNGWTLDLTSEGANDNFPPRPLKSMCVVNQRIYGIPLNGGSAPDVPSTVKPLFDYRWPTRDLPAVVWSKAYGDGRATKMVGDPQQSWPLVNIKHTPNIETPIWLVPSLTGDAVIVWTPRSTFLMTEMSDGLHTYQDISRIHGLGNPATVKVTDYGICWVDQQNQVCLLTSDSREGLIILSANYQDWLFRRAPTAANYLLDPPNEIDRYQIYFADGTFLVHDFKLKEEGFPYGMAYTGTDIAFTAAHTLVETDGKRHFVGAKNGFYTVETQPENGLIPTTDMSFLNTTDQTTATADINGKFRFNWDAITDWNERKKMAQFLMVGDAAPSAVLGRRPIILQWWGDFELVQDANGHLVDGEMVNQTDIDWQFRFIPKLSSRYVFKYEFQLSGHSNDAPHVLYYTRPGQEGDLAKNWYGAIVSCGLTIGNEGNRP